MKYGHHEPNGRTFGFPPALFPSITTEEQPHAASEPPTVDVLGIHWRLSVAVIAMAVVAVAALLI